MIIYKPQGVSIAFIDLENRPVLEREGVNQ